MSDPTTSDILAGLADASSRARFHSWATTVVPRLTDAELVGWVDRPDLQPAQRDVIMAEYRHRVAIVAGSLGLPRSLPTPKHRFQEPQRGVIAPAVGALVIGTAVSLALAGELWDAWARRRQVRRLLRILDERSHG